MPSLIFLAFIITCVSAQQCSLSTSCNNCVNNNSCLWCAGSNLTCLDFGTICNDAVYVPGLCNFNSNPNTGISSIPIYIIIIPIAVVLIAITLIICVYCRFRRRVTAMAKSSTGRMVSISLADEVNFEKLARAIKDHYAQKTQKPFPKCYICYAWYTEERKKEELRAWLLKLRNHLQGILGIETFLDIENMELNLKQTMEENIKKSDFFLVIATPRFKQRAEEPSSNNLKFELNLILEAKKQILPLLWEGDFNTSFPKDYPFKDFLVYDFTKGDYFRLLLGTTNPKGIVPTILGLQNDIVYAQLVGY